MRNLKLSADITSTKTEGGPDTETSQKFRSSSTGQASMKQINFPPQLKHQTGSR
jgi:hypothetical protein